MKITKTRGAIAAFAVAAMGAALALPSAAYAVEPNGSYGPVSVLGLTPEFDFEDVVGDTLAFDDDAMLSSLPYSTTYDLVNGPVFPGGADAASATLFLAADGQELTPNNYLGATTLTWDLATRKASFAVFSLSNLTAVESQAELDAVKTNGGNYSIGVSFATAGGALSTTIPAYWVDIHVTAGTGAWTWTAPVAADPCIADPNGVGCPPIRPQTAGGADVESAADLSAGQEISGLVGTINGNVADIHAGALTGFVQVWAYSTPTYLGSTTLDGSGDTISIAGLPAGAHTLILTETDGTVLGWGSFTITTATTDTAETDLTVDVITSNKFELNGVNTVVDLGDVKRGQTSTPVNLGAFTVIDDRNTLLGWDLTANVDTFVNGSATVPSSALGIAPSVTAAPAGIAVTAGTTAGAGTNGAVLATGAAGSSTGEIGTLFNAALSFKAPINAVAGTYTSTLTLTLASK